jgi:CAAX protease family protein
MTAAHLLAFFLIFVAPWDQVFILRLKRTNDPRARLRAYWHIVAWQWLATLAAVAILGPRALWYVHLNPADARWIPGKFVVECLAVVSLVVILGPLVVVARKPAAAPKLARALDRLRFVLPQSARERFWWAILSITAGICEECLFRSFLLQYLHTNPWRLELGLALAVACVVFAVAHLYQGVAAAAVTGLLAILLFILYLGSGSLLLPIIVHAIGDLRVLFLLRLAGASPAEAPAAGN